MPTDSYPSNLEFVREAITRLQNALQARGPSFDEIFEDLPSNLFPSGTLAASEEGRIVSELQAEFGRTEYTPSALGFAFLARDAEEIELTVTTRFSVYHPVLPNHAEVLHFVDTYSQGAEQIKLPPKYRRLPVEIGPITASIPLRRTEGFIPLEPATSQLQLALDHAGEIANMAADRYGIRPLERPWGKTRTYTVVDLRNSQWWTDRVATCTKKADVRWTAKVLFRVRRTNDGWLVEIMLCNTSPTSQWDVVDGTFIGAYLCTSARAGEILPTPLPEVELADYRFENSVFATGRNCDTNVSVDPDMVRIESESVPVYLQQRIAPRHITDLEGRPVEPTFEALAGEGTLGLLQRLFDAMNAYLQSWEDTARRAPGAAAAPEQVRASLRTFEGEVARFKRGLDLLGSPSHADLLLAFRLMNQAFARRFGEAGAKWRLFQIVFIVSELGSLIDRTEAIIPANEPPPTVLWFPTGSGKTEAYLGLVVLHAFWDRLRGKPFGVTAIAKFPLRLLSIQQFARVVQVMEHANDVRLAAPELDGHRGDDFSVGYYAGGSNTQNFLDWVPSPDRSSKPSTLAPDLQDLARRPALLQRMVLRHMKVFACPVCHLPDGRPGRINVDFDPDKPGFRHTCQNCHRELKLHLTDTEVVRWLPTLVIATIDKLARLATEPWGRTIFGGARVKCSRHGYLITTPVDERGLPTGRCAVLGCGQPLQPVPSNVDPVPSLLVQDEMHLLTESLGAFDSHYETMLIDTSRRCREAGIGQGPWKIIGSTATIEGYRQLIRQLYNYGDAVRFPERGPLKSQSFYSEETPEVQRAVVGVRSHGMSHVDTVMKVLLEIHKMTAPLAEPTSCLPSAFRPASIAGLSEPARAHMARRYRTVLTYGINRSEVAQVNRSYEGQLNPHMRRLGLPEFDSDRVLDLTGDSGAQAIQDFLETMQEGRDEGFYYAVTATSVVSHGVDLDNLNVMVFRGMPHTISEYIQAMSRVGRKDGAPALVVNVYNPNRERDASHFEAHQKYLELRELLLRNIPTTRFSRQALDKTLPGLLLHHVNYHRDPVDLWKRTRIDGFLYEVRDHPQEFLEVARRSLGLLTAPDPDSSLVRRQLANVDEAVPRVRTRLQWRPGGPDEGKSAAEKLGALRSLRETDVPVKIWSDAGTPEDDEG